MLKLRNLAELAKSSPRDLRSINANPSVPAQSTTSPLGRRSGNTRFSRTGVGSKSPLPIVRNELNATKLSLASSTDSSGPPCDVSFS